MRKQKVVFSLVGIITTLLVFSFGALAGYFLPVQLTPIISTAYSKLPFNRQEQTVAFLLEIYDKIKSEYWEDLSDEQLVILFEKAAKKQTVTSDNLLTQDRGGLTKFLTKLLKSMDNQKKKEFSANLVKEVLSNLRPAGRSGLYTQKMGADLKNLVQNINPDKDLYKDIGLDKGASEEKIVEAVNKQIQGFEKQRQQAKTTEEKQEVEKKMETIKYAKEVLTTSEKKAIYDTIGAEPTVFTRLITKDVLHLQIKRMSPTTFDEFKKALENYNKNDGPNSLILDLRGNIGGFLDIVPALTGAFLGPNQPAFDLFRKGKYEPVRTNIDKLPGASRFKQIVVIIDENGQSSTELLAVVFKRYNLGVLLGKKTKGWGTIEQLYTLNNQITHDENYSIFLVNNVTIRDDGQPIEGRGVEPSISLDNHSWDKELFDYFKDGGFVNAIKQVIN